MPDRRHIALYAAVAAILIFGLCLRARNLAATPLNGDEGESAINALTILQTGTPRGEYLGLPIYENVLTEPWNDHPEYEFRDSSYSPEGLAIYHGWLPLYAMAASMKAFGVAPDHLTGELRVQHGDEEIRRRVVAARFPALIFAAFFLLFLFLAAREMFGADAGLAAMAVGAVGRPFVYMGREARYHSATLALSTGCCWVIWRVWRHGSWPDFLLAALLLAMLFYTHLLAFLIASFLFTVVAIALLRRGGYLIKLISVGVIVAALSLPWILLSGFLHQTAHIPPARQFLSFPADLVYYPIVRVPYLILPLLGVVWLVVAYFLHHHLPARVTQPLARHRRQIAFLLAWVGIGILAFIFFIPAASYFYKRMTLPVVGPGVVWGAIVVAAAARSLWPQRSAILAPVVFVAAIVVGRMAYPVFAHPPDETEVYEVIDRLREMKLAHDTKLYCTPNHQLAITYLSGLPVQSVAPVRKEFLDEYRGPIVIIDSAPPYPTLWWEDVQRVASSSGSLIGEAQARELAKIISTQLVRERLNGRVARIEPPQPSLPYYAPALESIQREQTQEDLNQFRRTGANNPLLRHYVLHDWSQWWPIFFYRFVNPEYRMGDHVNYACRIRSATAEILPCSWVIYRCPPLRGAATAPTW